MAAPSTGSTARKCPTALVLVALPDAGSIENTWYVVVDAYTAPGGWRALLGYGFAAQVDFFLLLRPFLGLGRHGRQSCPSADVQRGPPGWPSHRA